MITFLTYIKPNIFKCLPNKTLSFNNNKYYKGKNIKGRVTIVVCPRIYVNSSTINTKKSIIYIHNKIQIYFFNFNLFIRIMHTIHHYLYTFHTLKMNYLTEILFLFNEEISI